MNNHLFGISGYEESQALKQVEIDELFEMCGEMTEFDKEVRLDEIKAEMDLMNRTENGWEIL